MNNGATFSLLRSSRREEALTNSRIDRPVSFGAASVQPSVDYSRFNLSTIQRVNALFAVLALVFFAFNSFAQTISPASLPLYFQANNSQTEFLSSGDGCQFTVSASGVRMSLRESKDRAATAQIRFVGANSEAQIAGGGKLTSKVNYFIGNDSSKWQIGLSTFANVQVTQLYPGINMIFHGNQRQLEYDFTVAPGANPNAVKMRFNGVDNISITPQGDLILKIGTHEIRQPKPEIYQAIGDARKIIAGGYKILDSQTVAFEVGEYDQTLPLVIDPVLGYSAFFGGNVGDTAWAIAVNPNDNSIYIAGSTFSTKFFTTGAVRTNFAGDGFTGDAFVAKLDQTGTNLIYLTYLGGSADDLAAGLAVDGAGNAFVGGFTQSLNFPTNNALISTNPAAFNPTYHYQPPSGWVAELNANGTNLIYSTYLGGDSQNYVEAIAVDSADNAYAVGYTYSTNFPVTTNALQPHFGGTNDTLYLNANAFLTEIGSGGSNLVYSTFLGGTNLDGANGVAVDPNNYVYVCGYTASFNFPTWNTTNNLPGAGHFNGITNQSLARVYGVYDAFVTKFPPLNGTNSPASQTNNAFSYSMFLGGTNDDVANGIAADAQGNAYVTGWTASTNFPSINAPPGLTSFLATNGNSGPIATNVFLTKISPTGSNVLRSVEFGGNLVDIGSKVAVDQAGDAFVVGTETSYTNFPTLNTFGSLLATNSSPIVGTHNAFVTGVSVDWSRVFYSVLLGGTYDTFGYGIALDSSTNVFITGTTLSTNYPTFNAERFSFNGINGITNVINGTNNINGNNFTGTNDAYVTKILFATPSASGSTVSVVPTSQTVGHGATVTFNATVSPSAIGQLFYQWQTNGTNLVNGGRISGATSPTLTITDAQTNDSSADYDVIVSFPSNSVSGNAITNSGNSLTVLDVPYIEATSPMNVVVPVGTNVSFSLTASGSPLFYNWFTYITDSYLTNNAHFSGATNSTLTISDVQTNDSGTYVGIVFETPNVYTDVDFTLTVVDPNFSVITAPTNQTVSAGATVSFAVVTTGFPLNYQWLTNGVPVTNGDNISGATSSTLTITDVQTNDAYTYTVSITNGVEYPGFDVSTNLSADLTVLSAPTFTSIDPPPGTSRMLLSGAGGKTNATYYVLTSTNLMTWRPMATNKFNSLGQFIFTNGPPTNSAQFFKLEEP